jgi:uncharacterized protein YdhG (YjbR/CyaY superfamily)
VTPKTVDEYIGAFPPKVQRILQSIRRTIRKAAPAAKESISYGIAGYKVSGRALIYFAGYASHAGVYPIDASVKKALGKELKPYMHGKATARFPLDERIPLALIRRIVKTRLER